MPTMLGVNQPLVSAPPRGKTLVFLQCDNPQCTGLTQGVAEAAAAGWNVKYIDFQIANPATLVEAMQQALPYHPVAVVLTRLPYAVWQSEVAVYAHAGVPLISAFVGPAPTGSTLIANIGGPITSALIAKTTADWFIAESGGEGKALLDSVPDLPFLADYSADFEQDVHSGCTRCSVTEIDSTIPEVESNGINPQIVSALQRDPSIKYAVSPDGEFNIGLPSALNAAGISGVKILGEAGTVENQTDVLQGTESMWSSQPLEVAGWTIVDVALRHLENMTIAPEDGGLPIVLLTKANIGTPTQYLNEPSEFRQQFKTLWHVQ